MAPLRSSTHPSAATRWPPLAHFIRWEAGLGGVAEVRGPVWVAAYEFLRFGIKQGWACLFGAIMLAAMLLTHWLDLRHAAISRYDVLFLTALVVQAIMLATRLERLDEAKVIAAFHIVGTAMELQKTSIGSWLYPEPCFFHLAGVPLFSGFMYASVGSYLARVWRLFDFRFARHLGLPLIACLTCAIYANFLLDHYGFDMRLGLIAATVLLFGRTTIYFRNWRVHRSMPLVLGFVLVALFIWFAEGGAAALQGLGIGTNVATTTLGLKAEISPFAAFPVTVRAFMGWRHAYGDVTPKALAVFAGGTSPFAVAGTAIDRDAAVAEAGLDYHVNRDLTLGIAYTGQAGARSYDNGVKGRLEYRF
jgi:uncharacterized membrane protein YoaT (DUF817 family)